MEENKKGKTLGELEQKIKDQQLRIAFMDADNSLLAEDLEHYKKVAAGLKGRNKQLAERVKHYKQLDLEGDRLYEEKIAELEEAKKEIARLKRMPCADAMLQTKCIELEEQVEKKNAFIEQLQCNVQELKIQLGKSENTIESQKATIEELDEMVIELNKPWWRRIF